MTAVLLVNTGSPKSCGLRDVRNYLTEFLMDGRVIDKPLLLRTLLVKGIIVPFRYKKSAESYAKIWQESGSPLIITTQKLAAKLEQKLQVPVRIAMRYGEPSIKAGLDELRGAKKIVIAPLFPQYASATSGSILQEAMRILSSWAAIPEISFLGPFVNEPHFMQAWQEVAKTYCEDDYDHTVISFHGLPLSQIAQTKNEPHFCYQAQCEHFGKTLAQKLALQKYTIAYQSRLGKDKWLSPYTSEVIKALAQKGNKKLLVIAPSFVADCLETLFEIGIEYQELFHSYGGKKIDFVPSLNTHPAWVDALSTIISSRL